MTPSDPNGITNPLTEIISEGGFKTLEAQRKRLVSGGVKAAVIAPPGVNLNG